MNLSMYPVLFADKMRISETDNTLMIPLIVLIFQFDECRHNNNDNNNNNIFREWLRKTLHGNILVNKLV